MTNERTATCACGRLSLETRGEAEAVVICSCQQCQKRTGSVYSAHAFFPEGCVSIRGDSTAFRRSSASGRQVTFNFCPECGSTLFWRADARPTSIGVAAGAFADPEFPAPKSAIWSESKFRWVDLPQGIPAHPQGTPPAGPPASGAR